MNHNTIYGINGPVVTVRNTRDFSMMEMVYVGNARLVGEVIGITSSLTTIQVYEETTSLRPGEPVAGTGSPMTVTLGPGILDNIFDGIERPLKAIEEKAGAFIERGLDVSPLDEEKIWEVTVTVRPGDMLQEGQPYAYCQETGWCRPGKTAAAVSTILWWNWRMEKGRDIPSPSARSGPSVFPVRWRGVFRPLSL